VEESEEGEEMSMKIIITSFPDRRQANKVSEALLMKRLAACVKLSPVRSSYWWKGRIEKSGEVVMTAVTDSKVSGRAASLIKKLHPYEVPEIIEVPARSMEKSYLEWVESVTKQ
jgi:periplasmic divalent cation tolerance protein